MHTSSGDHFYLYEANQRRYYYPPPYWYNNGWYYAYPWLWYDGDKHGAYQHSLWEAKITARMAIPAPFRATMWGDYTPTDGTGTIHVCFWNDSSASLTGRVQFVITEDSLYFVGPNGDPWHNHVARDYLPDHNGEVVSIPGGDSLILSRPFTIDPSWNESKCQIVTWIQDDYMQPDTVKEIWQGGLTDLSALSVTEKKEDHDLSKTILTPSPNPCSHTTTFHFTLPHNLEYSLSIYDISGRPLRHMKGTASGMSETLSWNLKNSSGKKVNTGIYLYRFESSGFTTQGKIIVW